MTSKGWESVPCSLTRELESNFSDFAAPFGATPVDVAVERSRGNFNAVPLEAP